MEVLLRYVRQGSGGGSDFLDTAVSVDEITIGSAADSTLQLLGRNIAGTHAVIQGSGADLRIVCRRGRRVGINGTERGSGPLAVADRIELGGHRLTLFAPPSGFDVAIEVRPDAGVAASDFEAAFDTDLDRTWLSKRSASWVLTLLTLTLGLGIPLLTISLHRHGQATPAALPGDALWSPAPLTPAHAHAAGNRCNACHQVLFAHVQDPACRDCHKTTADHVSMKHRALTRLADPARCGECHAEHTGAARLVIEDDQLCVTCHANSDRDFGSLKVHVVSGFRPGLHPAFSVALQKLAGAAQDASNGATHAATHAASQVAAPDASRLASPDTAQLAAPGAAQPAARNSAPAASPIASLDAALAPGDLEWATYRVPLAGAVEESNLKFSHAEHLDPDKVTRTSGSGALGCRDCHILGADGEHFQPLTMAKTCSACHQLNFDLSAPDRQLPHGKPLDAMLMIEDYFARKYSDPPPVTARTPVRRLPDLERDPSRQAEVDICTGPPVACARQRARTEIENQFTGRGCVSCHAVVDTHRPELHERFQVTPVRLGYDYFPTAHFPHKTHEIQGKLTGDAACESCHAARKSTEARELLLPDIDRCLQCHRDRPGAGGSAVAAVMPTLGGTTAGGLTTGGATAGRTATEGGTAGSTMTGSTMTGSLVDGGGLVGATTTGGATVGTAAADGAAPAIVALRCISCHVYHPSAILSAARSAEK